MLNTRTIGKRVCDDLGIPRYWVLSSLDELRIIGVRLFHLLPMQRRRIRALVSKGQMNLNIGCGDTKYEGWVGVDCYFSSAADLVLDLRRPLPFPSESVDNCYSEHFLEHLFPEDGRRHLQEVYRVLKRGGVYRVVVPDAIKFVERYLAGDGEFFKLAFPWAKRPMQAIYDVFNWGGIHRNILDYSELELMAREAGFARCDRSEANRSRHPILRIDRSEAQRIAESLYVEMVKE